MFIVAYNKCSTCSYRTIYEFVIIFICSKQFVSRTIFIDKEDVREYYTSRLIYVDLSLTYPITHLLVWLLSLYSKIVAHFANPIGSLPFERMKTIAASITALDLIVLLCFLSFFSHRGTILFALQRYYKFCTYANVRAFFLKKSDLSHLLGYWTAIGSLLTDSCPIS